MRSALIAMLLLVGACGGSSSSSSGGAASPSSKSSLLGKAAPSFKREALDGSAVQVAQPGKVVVVKFVAKYCQPCVRTLPAIEKLHAKHPEIIVVGISEDEDVKDARELVATYNLTFPMVHDNQQVLAARYRVSDLPVTYVLDGKGNVAWVGGPEKTEDDLVSAIESTKP
jgi:cytochrome c biogenesis protein CcmG/thiol:disulfide interchange protein DsbE